MTLQKRLWDLVVLAIFVSAAVFATAPWFAFRALAAAARYEDVAAIGKLVDFPAVRASLTGQLDQAAPAAAAEPPSLWRDPLGAMRRAIAPIAPQQEPRVDRYLTVAGLSALTRGYPPGKAPPEPQDPGLLARIGASLGGPHPSFAYWDPNRVRIAVRRPHPRGKVTVFTFERRGLLSWTLVQIRLPPDERS
ncbi:MAG: hypothetical protein JWP92_56 [Caulobacter sp.]|nr:hypothetical protein [Caulobacter sp.]